MQLARIEIKNVLGISDQVIEPESNVVVISGRNGTGKTSVIEAIKDALGRSQYTELLRDGCDKGSVLLDLGDLQVSKKYTPNRSSSSVTQKVLVGTKEQTTKLSKPATVLKQLVGDVSFDPVRLLTLNDKELIAAFIDAIPAPFDPDAFLENCPVGSLVDTEELEQQRGNHSLNVIGAIYKNLYDKRRDVNTALDAIKRNNEAIRGTLYNLDDQPTLEECMEMKAGFQATMDKAAITAKGKVRELRRGVLREKKVLEEKRTNILEQIAGLRAQLNIVDGDLDQLEANLNQIDESETQFINEANATVSKEIEQVGLLVSKHEFNQRTGASLAESDKELAATQKTATKLDTAVKAIRDYKNEVVGEIPIKGLTIEDGQVRVNGIPFSTINTAEKVKIVVELAKLAAGDLKLLVLDNTEFFDRETFDKFVEEAKKTDLTFIMARVESDDFKIQ